MKKYIPIVLLVVAIDQITKVLARIFFEAENKIIIENVFHLTFTKNTGAGFSILQGNNLLLIFITIAITAALAYYFTKADDNEKLPLSLIIGGAVGNLIDRVMHGGVIDFIQVSIWPVFNIADMAISIGAVLLIMVIFKKKKD